MVALPRAAVVGDLSQGQQRWLGRGRLSMRPPAALGLQRVLRHFGIEPPGAGLGALRLLGQTGAAPSRWVAAADLVFLRAGMSRLRLHALGGDELNDEEAGLLLAAMRDLLLDDDDYELTCEGRFGYLHAVEPVFSASVSPEMIDGRTPDEHMPAGAAAAGYLRMLSEMQMCLHGHEINARREAAGLRPANSLWIWGGGTTPAAPTVTLPVLFANDPLTRGYWRNAAATNAAWREPAADLLESAPAGFVAVMPDGRRAGTSVADVVDQFRQLLRRRHISRLTLLFADGLSAEVERRHAWRFWRAGLPARPGDTFDD